MGILVKTGMHQMFEYIGILMQFSLLRLEESVGRQGFVYVNPGSHRHYCSFFVEHTLIQQRPCWAE